MTKQPSHWPYSLSLKLPPLPHPLKAQTHLKTPPQLPENFILPFASAILRSTILLRMWPGGLCPQQALQIGLFYPARSAPLQSGLPPVGVL